MRTVVAALLLAAAGVALVAWVRGHLDWAHLHGRRTAGVLTVSLLVLTGIAAPSDGDPGDGLNQALATPRASASPASTPSTGDSSRPPSPSASPSAVPSPPEWSRTSVPPAPAGGSGAPAGTKGAVAGGTVQVAAAASTLAAVDQLDVKGRAPMTGYARAAFGSAWYDLDRNGCDTRNDVLRRDLVRTVIKDGTHGCTVLSGDAAPGPYTGATIHFVRGGASEIDIDHVVALGDAWVTGAQYWSADRRLALANDPLNLLAVDASANRQKGDSDAASWLPANKGYRCAYVARQVAVKRGYGLWVTAAEADAMRRVLATCPAQQLPTASTVPLASPAPAPARAGNAPAPARTTQAPAPVRASQAPAPAASMAPTRTSPPAAPAPVRASSAPAPHTVHPGSFCSPTGATGVTSAGTPMVCGPTAKSPDRARWHKA